MESLPKHSSPQELPKEEMENPSRREFLKQSGALFAATALEAHGMTLPGASASERNKESIEQAYRQGIELLREKALFEDSEEVGVFVVKKDGTSAWITIPKDQREGSNYQASISENFLQTFLADKDVERVDFAHTHPLKSISRDAELISHIQKGEATPLAMPPSLSDLFALVTNEDKKLNDIVVDPSGVWGIELAENPKDLLLIKLMMEQTKPLTGEISQQDDVKKLSQEGKILAKHPGLILMELQSHQEELSPKSRALVESLVQKLSDLTKSTSLIDFVSKVEQVSGHQVLDDEKKLEELKELYKGIGVNLSFAPHRKS